MTLITYVLADGTRRDVDVEVGSSVMEGARENDIPGIVADCGGACACSTCHVYVDRDWIDKLPVPDAIEQDMIEFAWQPEASRSRLTCQLRVRDDLEGLIVHIPERQN
ncbi:2Fe-2S iron-sulfur cluster binding domain-containing protein [Rhizobium lusitanum]|uniref:2Fe-2S iron-sulfur cluster binding domain-containing protein n=1 Tax=Rhizobium lusitanum TaxID=293958 RepID=A0A6L9UDE7_9HYPH|nr:2Fe-2S iron-sulfur cluster-binding protein [Rhizobium lusitanum]NEI73624.1 2Fe-2S iron-sulfur cluster binding domain-containing protein [Rhizobium lusitanum]